MKCWPLGGVSENRVVDQCGWCQWFEARLSIPNRCYNKNIK